ncbi:MAG: tetratricopeptide repeat protein [Candidatus Zixiibacteriota bacterium]
MNNYKRTLSILALLALLIFASGGCVYYNTFFNARQAFNNAEKYRKKTGIGTQSSYNEAIKKALKVVESHPKSGYYDDALYVLGVSYFYTKQYGRADRRLRELIADYPKSKYVNDARLYLAKTKLESDEVENAVAIFDEIFQGKYSKQFRAEAAMALGNYHLKQKDHATALRFFMSVRDSLGDESQKLQSQRLIADGYFDSFKFGDALKGYLQVLGLKPDHDDRFHSLYRAALCSYRLQRTTAGFDYLNQLIKDPLFYDSLGVLNLAVGEGYEASSDLDQAENVYLDVAMTSKNNQWVGEAYYRLGLIYQFDYDDLPKAKSYYDKAASSSGGTESGRDATARAADIGRLQGLVKAGVDTAAVRMAQQGLDSLINSDISDEDLRKEYARLTKAAKKTDSTSLSTPSDSLKKDSSTVVDSLKLVSTRPADSLKRDSAITDSMAAKGAVSPTLDSLALPDSAAVRKDTVPVVRPDSAAVPKDSIPAVNPDSTVGVIVKSGPQRLIDSLKHIDDSLAAVERAKKLSDSASAAMAMAQRAALADSLRLMSDSLNAAEQLKRYADSTARINGLPVGPDSLKNLTDSTSRRQGAAALHLGDSLTSLDSLRMKALGDSTGKSNATIVKQPDSLGAAGSEKPELKKDTAYASKLRAANKPKVVKDTGITREQIWNRINDAAQSLYALAELYWFQLDKPDSAMKQMQELLTLFPKSDKAPQAMIALAQMYRDYKADTATADSLLHTALKQFPRSDHAPEALSALGLIGTPADTGYPQYYMHRADSFLVDAKQYDSARYYYSYVSKRFRLSRYRPQAAFNAIWVTENYLSPGDSSVYLAYKNFADSFSTSTFAQEANRRLTFVPPPKIPRPVSKKKSDAEKAEDSLSALGPNLVAKAMESVPESTKAYVDPRTAAFVGPKKEELIILDLKPTEIGIEFVYPTEAYNIEGTNFELYFQILLDVTGRVIDVNLKVPTSSEELNRRAQQTVASMRFDPLAVSSELQRKARDIVLPEDQVDPRGRWYVLKYLIAKPDYAR